MKMKKINVTETIVADIQLHIVQNGSGGPVIFWGMYPHQGGEVEHFWEALMELVPEQKFLLVAFQVEDWNRDFSPWEAPAAFGTEAFDGQGARTLKWLLEEGVPYIDRTYHVKEQEHWLAGYSLAGLFALWAAYECDTFSGIACCSGSLWFKDWDIYMREHKLKRKCSVYLSLGGKEEKTKNAVMATVGDRTREQEKLLLEDPFAELIRIEDIAHALSMICRGNGHVKTFWSVGQHCICCAREAAARGLSNRMVLACLLHDASECYMSDVPTPFKNELPEYQEQEEHLLGIIYEKFFGSDLTEEEQKELKEIDHAMLWYDLEHLLGEIQYGEIPELHIDLDYTVRPFEEVEEEYLSLFEKIQ